MATNRFSATQGYTFDKNGNLVADAESRAFTFNGDNKQTKVVQNGQTVGEYFFDGEGKRVKKKVYDPENPGVVTEETIFVYSNGKLIAEYSTKPPPPNPTTSYTVTDHLGSPRVIVNSLGEVTARRDFRPFGEQVMPDGTHRTTNLKYTTGDDIRQKFTGYQKDEETQLDFAEARMYENRHARFMAVDPLLASGKSANPQSFNRYLYVLNNPLVLTDPEGLQAGWAIDHRNVSPTGEKTPWVYFQHFPGNVSRDTHNAANGHDFQPFHGKYYMYADGKFAYLHSSGQYYEGVYNGSTSVQEVLGLQAQGNTSEVDRLILSARVEGRAIFTGSQDNSVTANPEQEQIRELINSLISQEPPAHRPSRTYGIEGASLAN